MRAVIDTNILIYDTVEDSEKHVHAENLLESLDRLLIPPLVLYEYIWFFKRQGLEGNEIKELVEGYLTDPLCTILVDDGTPLKKALEIITSQKLTLARFNDIVILSYAINEKAPLATFDRKLRENAQEFKIRILPEKI